MEKEIIQKLYENLIQFKESLIRETEWNYSEEYKKSKWYRKATLKDAVGERSAADFAKLENALKEQNTEAIKELEGYYKDTATEYGRSYYDDDLKCVRSGYEFETAIYTRLYNTTRVALGKPEMSIEDFYEGIGYA